MSSYYSSEEIEALGLKCIGTNVLISRNACLYNPEKISIGSDVRIDDFCILSGNVNIGNNVHIAVYCSLFAGDSKIIINDFCGVSAKSSIYAVTDDYSGEYLTNPTVPYEYKNIIQGTVTLGKHVLIGTNSVVLPNVKIGDGVSIGACSLVLHDCDEWSIYVGIPVKKIKNRSKKLLELEAQYISNKIRQGE